MALKKKKTSARNQDSFAYVGHLDDISSCISRAENNPVACIDGIVKADMVLSESRGDPDIQCVAMMKKAELMFIAHKHKYNLEDLPGDRRQYSLDRCIAECEKVLNEFTSDYSAGKQVCEKAKSICVKAWKLKEDLQKEERIGAPRHTSIRRYDATKTSFKSVDMINSFLLQDVVGSYRKARIVCRFCYFRSRIMASTSVNSQCRGCRKYPQSLLLIPASKMCDNLGGTSEVPILPPPQLLLTPSNRHKPFQMCKNTDHQLCEDKASIGENRFAHSIEELVVWTIERHFHCKFSKYIDDNHSISNESRVAAPLRVAPEPIQEVNSHEYLSEDGDDYLSDSYSEHEEGDRRSGKFEYYPEELIYEKVSMIPQNLLLNIVEKYRKVREYCKWCYYQRTMQGTMAVDHQTDLKVCSNCTLEWDSVKVIPASELCWNFGEFDFLPIAPWPVGKPRMEPFEYCKKKDHYRCFRVYIDSAFWFPHSVEEMVIWTVEREKNVTFSVFIRNLGLHPASRNGNRSLALSSSSPSSSTSLAPVSSYNPPQFNNMSDSVNHRSKENVPINPQGEAYGLMPVRPSISSKTLLEQPYLQGRMEIPGPNSSNMVMSGGGGGPMIRGPGPDMRDSLINGEVNPHHSMMYLPRHQMYHQGRQVLLPRGMPVGLQQGQVMNFPQHAHHIHYGPRIHPHHQQNSHTFSMPPPHSNPYFRPMNSNFNVQMLPASGANPVIRPNSSVPPGGMMGGGYLLPQELGRDDGEMGKRDVGRENGPQPPVVNDSGPAVQKSETTNGGVGVNSGTVSPVSSRKTGSMSSIGGRKNYSVAPQSPEKRGVTSVGGNNGGVGVGSRGKGGSGEVVEVCSPGDINVKSTLQVFKFSEVNFKGMDDIPASLIKSVALCFKEKKIVCRLCFFGERDLSEEDQGQLCSSGEHKWLKPIVVIPGCSHCDNEPSFQQGDHVPILPLPPVAVLKKCTSKNHHKCFTKALEKQLFQAHSVEELVVWLVESEKECTLEAYVKEIKLDKEEGERFTEVVPTPPPKVTSSITTVAAMKKSPTPTKPSIASPSPVRSVETIVKSTIPSNITPVRRPPLLPPPQTKPDVKYNPKDVEFASIRDIPPLLLSSVAESFKNSKLVCRICFFNSSLVLLIGKKYKKVNAACKKDHTPWRSIRVIPRSPLCVSGSQFVPVLPLPKHMKHLKNHFVVCKKRDHTACYAMSKDTNPWFPHTVEELVIWTVERESNMGFEDLYKKYLPRAQMTMGSNLRPMEGNVSTTSRTDMTNYSAVVANPSANVYKKPSPEMEEKSAFSPVVARQPPPSGAGNSQPYEEVGLQPPNDYSIQDATLAEIGKEQSNPSNYYPAYSQPPPPGYPLRQQFYPPQPPQMYQNHPHAGYAVDLPARGVGSRTQEPAQQPIGRGRGSRTSKLTSLTGILPDRQEELETHKPLSGIATTTDFPVQQRPTWNGDFFDTWDKKRSGEDSGDLLRNAIWHEEDPIPGHSQYSSLWSRAVGEKSDFHAYNLQSSPHLSSSQQSYESRSLDELVHQSQVEGDSFQPYASVKPSPLIPAIAERRVGKDSESMGSSNDTIDTRKGLVDSIEAKGVHLATLNVNMHSSFGAPGTGYETSNNPSTSDSRILISAMAAANEGMSFTSGGNGIDNIRRSSGHSSMMDDDIYHSDFSKSTSPDEDTVVHGNMDETFCLLCYKNYTSQELKSHCSTDLEHLELAQLDCGADVIWQYPPPPLQRPRELKVCTGASCVGPPHCSKPHNLEQLQEWLARWKHRQQRNKSGAHLIIRRSSPNLDENCLSISESQVLQTVVSEPTKIINNGYCWEIIIQGQNWLNLFGVTAISSCSWTFKVTHIEGTVSSAVFHPHSPTWQAPLLHGRSFRQCLLLGSVQIKVKAIPPFASNNGKKWAKDEEEKAVSGKVVLDLGYKQSLFVELAEHASTSVASVNNAAESSGRQESYNHSSNPHEREEDMKMVEQYPQQQQQQLQVEHPPVVSPPQDMSTWADDSDYSDDLGDLNIDGEDLTLQHDPIEDWGCSLTG